MHLLRTSSRTRCSSAAPSADLHPADAGFAHAILLFVASAGMTAGRGETHRGPLKWQQHNQGVTEIVEIPNRGHALVVDRGWREGRRHRPWLRPAICQADDRRHGDYSENLSLAAGPAHRRLLRSYRRHGCEHV